MAFAPAPFAPEPLREMNTTPLIDVMLVLLVMMIMTIPLATHSFEVDLPARKDVVDQQPNRLKNMLVIASNGHLLWNDRPVSDGELASLLAKVRAMAPEPEVQFRPDANASYERSAQILAIVKQSRITRFGFVDNEKYRAFGR